MPNLALAAYGHGRPKSNAGVGRADVVEFAPKDRFLRGPKAKVSPIKRRPAPVKLNLADPAQVQGAAQEIADSTFLSRDDYLGPVARSY